MMEKLYPNSSDSQSTITSICWILSVISWILFIITNAICFHWIKYAGTVWTFFRVPIIENGINGYRTTDKNMGTYPIQIFEPFFYIMFGVLFLIILVVFCVYMCKSICKKILNLMNKWCLINFQGFTLFQFYVAQYFSYCWYNR